MCSYLVTYSFICLFRCCGSLWERRTVVGGSAARVRESESGKVQTSKGARPARAIRRAGLLIINGQPSLLLVAFFPSPPCHLLTPRQSPWEKTAGARQQRRRRRRRRQHQCVHSKPTGTPPSAHSITSHDSTIPTRSRSTLPSCVPYANSTPTPFFRYSFNNGRSDPIRSDPTRSNSQHNKNAGNKRLARTLHTSIDLDDRYTRVIDTRHCAIRLDKNAPIN